VELASKTPLNKYVNVFANYAHQWKPVVRDLPRGHEHRRRQLAGGEPSSMRASISTTQRFLGNCR
jgi:muramoyltetrapeptide carboxypeptidase LdcA involved in peptidoglycan recycling